MGKAVIGRIPDIEIVRDCPFDVGVEALKKVRDAANRIEFHESLEGHDRTTELFHSLLVNPTPRFGIVPAELQHLVDLGLRCTVRYQNATDGIVDLGEKSSLIEECFIEILSHN